MIKALLNWFFLFWVEFLPYGKIPDNVKRIILTKYGAVIGVNPTIHSGVWIRPVDKLVVGDNVVISRDVVITTAGGVAIGNDVMIGYGSKLISANHIIPDKKGNIRFSGHENKPITIEDEVWISAQVVILPGVRMGKGSVAAAGAVVTKDVPPYVIVGGVPARSIRYRK